MGIVGGGGCWDGRNGNVVGSEKNEDGECYEMDEP
jgi:hypothetical protein